LLNITLALIFGKKQTFKSSPFAISDLWWGCQETGERDGGDRLGRKAAVQQAMFFLSTNATCPVAQPASG
jgi:hypothetical protein